MGEVEGRESGLAEESEGISGGTETETERKRPTLGVAYAQHELRTLHQRRARGEG